MNKAILILSLVCFAAASVTIEDHIAVLTTGNFDDYIKEHEFVLVEFYAPWCGHCKSLAPEFSKASEETEQEGSSAKFAKIDATVETELAQRFGVSGYPSLKFFVNGEAVEYNGGRKAPEIKSWVAKRTGSISTELKSQDELKEFQEKHEVAVVYFGDSEADTEWAAFRAVAMENDSLAFAHIFAAEAKGGVSGHSLTLFKKFDEGKNDFTGTFDLANLKTFLNDNSYPTLMPFDERAIPRVFQQANPTIFLFHKEDEAGKAAQAAFTDAAKANKGGKVLFSLSTENDGHGLFGRLAEYVGVNTERVPAVMLVHAEQGGVNKFQFDQDITVANLDAYIKDYNEGKLEKYMKSEPIPETNDGPVKILVGKNFDDIVLNSTQDVLVKFYAPWCGHCKTIAPIYEKVAEILAANKNIVLAKIDSTANEVPSVNVSGFPTLKFYPSHNKKEPIEYDGGRDEAGFLKWLEEKSTYEWVKPAESAEKNNEDL